MDEFLGLPFIRFGSVYLGYWGAPSTKPLKIFSTLDLSGLQSYNPHCKETFVVAKKNSKGERKVTGILPALKDWCVCFTCLPN